MNNLNNINIGSIEDAIKQLEDLKKDRLSFVTGDKEHDEIYLKDVQAIEIVLGNLEALADMQKTADRELENARKIKEEHKRKNGELRNKVKELEEELYSANKILEEYLDGVPKQKIKDAIEKVAEYKIARATNKGYYYDYFINQDYKEDFIKLFNKLLED